MQSFRFSLATLILSSTLSIHSISAYAAEAQLTPIVVTATRTAQKADETLAPVTVVTREDIEQAQVQDLRELLSGLIGLDTTSTGGYGQNSSYFIRGASSKHILVLLDDMQLGSATLGYTDIGDIGLDNVERIEIVRGPRSSLYGSSAIGGVIHIITRKAEEGTHGSLRIGYGSQNTRSIATNVGGGSQQVQMQLDYSRLTTDGFNVTEGNDPDEDSHEVERLGGQLHVNLSPGADITLNAYDSRSTTDYDGYTSSTDYQRKGIQHFVGANINFSPVKNWDVKLSGGYSKDNSDDYENGVRSYIYRTERYQSGWQNDIMLSDTSLLILGVDQNREKIDSDTAYDETERTVTGSYVALQQGFDKQDINISLRSDNYSGALGQHTTGNLDWGYSLNDDLRLTAGYGTAFKAPTFNDLYYPSLPWGAGNPDLKPESASSVEIGLRGKTMQGEWRVSAFRTEIDDLIEWQCTANCSDADPYNDLYQPLNVSRARIDGIEAGIEHHRDNSDYRTTLTLLDPKNLDTGKQLQNRATATLRIDADHKYGDWRNGITLLAQNDRYADSANSDKLAGYLTVCLRSSYQLNHDWQLQGKIENLFDQQYRTTASNYRPLGRTWMLNLRYALGAQ